MLLCCFDWILIGEKQKGIKKIDFHAILAIGSVIDLKDYKELEIMMLQSDKIGEKNERLDLKAKKRWKIEIKSSGARQNSKMEIWIKENHVGLTKFPRNCARGWRVDRVWSDSDFHWQIVYFLFLLFFLLICFYFFQP